MPFLCHPRRAAVAVLTTLTTFVTLALPVVGFTGVTVALGGAAAWGKEPDQELRLVSFRSEAGTEVEVAGKLLVTAQDGGRLLLNDEGHLFLIQPDQLIDDQPLEGSFRPVGVAEMERRLAAELPPDFNFRRTSNYLIAHNCDEFYARWVGGLFESLHRGMHVFFSNQRWKLDKPEFPLVALVFADRASFDAYATKELGEAAKNVIGYYHLETNRMVTFKVPDPERNVSTIIHEATHQLAYNTGIQTRFADNPMWISEGLALFFEAPNFNSLNGWKGVGRVNYFNLELFRKLAPNRPPNALETLLIDDTKFRQPATQPEAYAESWAFTYFLMKKRGRDLIRYLQALGDGTPMVPVAPRERLALFQKIFGAELADLDREFIAFMARVR